LKPDWRVLEAKVAEYFGGKRRKMRRYQLQGPDVNSPLADLEVKLRNRIPSWIVKYLKKARSWRGSRGLGFEPQGLSLRTEGPKGKIVAVVLYEKPKDSLSPLSLPPRPEEGVALLSTSDLKELLTTYGQFHLELSSRNEPESASTPPGKVRSRLASRRQKPRKSLNSFSTPTESLK